MLMVLTVGIESHLFLDACTYDGIHTITPTYNKKTNKKKAHKLRFVPHTDAFKTGTTYESIVRWLLYVGFLGMVLYTMYKILTGVI